MNEPIISPWLIYLLTRIDHLLTVWVILMTILGITLVIFVIVFLTGAADNDNELKEKSTLMLKKFLLPFFIVLFLTILTPSGRTLIQMIVAHEITYGRVDKALASGKVIKDEPKKDIIDVLQSVNKDDKEGKK